MITAELDIEHKCDVDLCSSRAYNIGIHNVFSGTRMIYCKTHYREWFQEMIHNIHTITPSMIDNSKINIALNSWSINIKRPDSSDDVFSTKNFPKSDIFKSLYNVVKFLPDNETIDIELVLYYEIAGNDLTRISDNYILKTKYGDFFEVKKNNTSQAHFHPTKPNIFLYPLWTRFNFNKSK